MPVLLLFGDALIDAPVVPDAYLRPLMAPLLGSVSPNATAMFTALDTAYSAAQAALAQATIDFDPRVATGDALVNMGLWGGVQKVTADSDDDLRRKILAGPTPTPSSKAGIAQQVGALTGVPVTVQTLAPGQFVVTLFGNSPRAAEVMPLVRRLKASGMQPRGQMLVPRPNTSKLGVLKLGTGKLGGASVAFALPDPTAPSSMTIPLINTPLRPYGTSPRRQHARLGHFGLGLAGLGT